jgi:VanZ family protein
MMRSPVLRAWALSLVWVGVIVMESFAGSSENTARVVYPLLRFLFPTLSFTRLNEIHYFLRKVGHFSGYGILSFTLYRAWWTTLAARATPHRLAWRDMFRAWSGRAVLLALLGTMAVAGLDEFHQSFSPGRTAKLGDVVLDEMGGVFAQTVIVILGSSVPAERRKRQPKPQSLISS